MNISWRLAAVCVGAHSAAGYGAAMRWQRCGTILPNFCAIENFPVIRFMLIVWWAYLPHMQLLLVDLSSLAHISSYSYITCVFVCVCFAPHRHMAVKIQKMFQRKLSAKYSKVNATRKAMQWPDPAHTQHTLLSLFQVKWNKLWKTTLMKMNMDWGGRRPAA